MAAARRFSLRKSNDEAAVFDRYGPADVLEIRDVAAPVPGENEVLIRIHATVATPSDAAFRSARPPIVRLFAGLTKPKYPIIGASLAGVVESVGPAVARFAPGERIYGASGIEAGTSAELKCMTEDSAIAPMPEGLGFAEAVALSEGFLTALPFLREGGVGPNTSILINGASGSIGTVALQLARHMGATVTGVCSGRNVDLVADLGAHRVIDYQQEDFTVSGVEYDVIFDAVGKSSFGRCRRALKPGGYYLTTVPTLGIMLDMLFRARGTGKRAKLLTTGLRPDAEKVKDLLHLNTLVSAGVLHAVIDRTYPLEKIVEAHRYVETERKRGSVVVAIGNADNARGSASRDRLSRDRPPSPPIEPASRRRLLNRILRPLAQSRRVAAGPPWRG